MVTFVWCQCPTPPLYRISGHLLEPPSSSESPTPLTFDPQPVSKPWPSTPKHWRWPWPITTEAQANWPWPIRRPKPHWRSQTWPSTLRRRGYPSRRSVPCSWVLATRIPTRCRATRGVQSTCSARGARWAAKSFWCLDPWSPDTWPRVLISASPFELSPDYRSDTRKVPPCQIYSGVRAFYTPYSRDNP